LFVHGATNAPLLTKVVGALAAYCFCCDLELDKEATKALPEFQIWLWSVVALVVYMAWLLGLEIVLARFMRGLRSTARTCASYAVILRGAGPTRATDDEIAEFARHYGEVVQVVRLHTIGEPLRIGHKV
jgi:hypothetical protein